MTKERVEYLDAIKAFAIWMVVFCHYLIGLKDTSVFQNILMTFCWAAVPCFFMVSGGLSLNSAAFSFKKWRDKLIKYILVLLAWRVIYLALGEIILRRAYGKAELFSYLFINRNLEGLDTNFMWFIAAFIAVHLLYPVLWHIWHDEKNGTKLSLLVIVIAYIPTIGVNSLNFIFERICVHFDKTLIEFWTMNDYFLFQRWSNMLVYFLIGGFLFKYREEIKAKISRWKTVFPATLIAAGTAGLLVVKHAATGSFRWSGEYLEDGYFWTSTVLLSVGVYLLIMLNHIPGSGLLGRTLGRHTLGIYYIHYIILIFADYYLYSFIESVIPFDYGLNTIKTVIILAVSLGLTIGIGRIPVVKKLVE